MLAIFVWPAWTNATLLVTGNDLLLQFYPWQVLLRVLLGTGEFPFWNPYIFSGVPAFANPQMAYAYPPHWALAWAPAIPAVNWTMGLHVLLAGWGAAWCAGRLGASRKGQFLSGVVYALGGTTAGHLWAGHLPFVEGMAWLPLATGVAIRIGQRHAIVSLALVTALMVLTGQPEIPIFCLWWLPLWAVLATLQEGWVRAIRALVRVGLGLGLGLGLAAVQIAPAAALYAVTNRPAGSSWEWLTAASLPPWHLLGAIAPNVFGDSGSYWPGDGWQWHERLLYVGLAPLLAAVRAPGRWRWICWSAAAVAVALAFGSYAPWYAWVQRLLPGYQSFRIPPKHLVLAALALALAAGLGIRRLQGFRVAVGCLAAAVLVAAASVTFGQWFPAMAPLLGGSEKLASPGLNESIAVLAAPGLRVAALVLGLVGAAALLPERWAPWAQLLIGTLELGLVLGPYRAHPADPQAILGQGEGLRGQARAAVVGKGGALLANYGALLGVTQPAGYLNLFSKGYSNLAAGSSQSIAFDIDRADDPALYLLGYGVIVEPEKRLVTVVEPPPPLAWVARCTWPGDALDVRKPDFPRKSCIARAGATEREQPVPPGAANVIAERSGWLMIEAEGPGWLVTVQPWYPGWSARVDGEPAVVEAVDGALVGVPLVSGQHSITLRYRPAGLELGMVISVLVGLILLASWWWDRRGWPLRLG